MEGLTKIHGPGCSECLHLTGPEQETSSCPRCGSVVACADVSLKVQRGEVFGLVGESGAGKSTVVQCLYFDEEPTYGRALFQPYKAGQRDIFTVSRQERRFIRNNLMGMVYQSPHLGLNLDFTSGGNIAEKLLMAGIDHVGHIREVASRLLERMEVPVARLDETPRHLSGGMQQRVQTAKAMANNPPLLLFDEVTSGLDVSAQAGVLDLIREAQKSLGLTMIVVSHDLGVIRLLTQRAAVMKNGRIVESGLTDQILDDPQHPYSQLLVSSQV